jgi:hypothetical protein
MAKDIIFAHEKPKKKGLSLSRNETIPTNHQSQWKQDTDYLEFGFDPFKKSTRIVLTLAGSFLVTYLISQCAANFSF